MLNLFCAPGLRRLFLWGLFLPTLLFVGCGGGGNAGSGDFVFTGNNTAPGNTAPGSMTFNFIKAQSPLEVPVNTTDIRFRFYSGPGGNGVLLQEETRPFANTITIDPVNGDTQSVVITALTADGFPILQATVDTSNVSDRKPKSTSRRPPSKSSAKPLFSSPPPAPPSPLVERNSSPLSSRSVTAKPYPRTTSCGVAPVRPRSMSIQDW